jgi:phage protein D
MGSSPLNDIAVWAALTSGCVEVFTGGAPGEAPTSLITGKIDSVHIDAVNGTAAIEGRDLSASMVDSYQQGDFVNQTASEVVATIAGRHGLSAVVTPTPGFIGRYYGDGYTRLSTGQFSRLRSDWDLVVELARESQFDVFVEGMQLFFQPTLPAPATLVPVTPSMVESMRFNRSLLVAASASARVQSWNSQNMACYDSSSGAATAPLVGLTSQPFLFSASNFTSAQVTQSAARYTAELNRLQTTLLVEMPWNPQIAPRGGIVLSETGSVLDGLYLVDSVERFYSSTFGSRQAIKAVSVAGLSGT